MAKSKLQSPQCIENVNGRLAYTITPCPGERCPYAAGCWERQAREKAQAKQQRLLRLFYDAAGMPQGRDKAAWRAYDEESERSGNSVLAYQAFCSVKYPGEPFPFEHLLPKAQARSSNV